MKKIQIHSNLFRNILKKYFVLLPYGIEELSRILELKRLIKEISSKLYSYGNSNNCGTESAQKQ